MKLRFILLFLIVVQFGFANEFKFGKVSEEEVMAKEHHLDPEANAAILFKKEWVHYTYDNNVGWSLIREVNYRIKIYNKDGFDWATLEVPLYAASGMEENISSIKGYTFNIDGDKLVSEKLKKDGIFIEEVNKYRNKSSITMPNVKEGSVLDIAYRVSSPIYWYMDEFKLQYQIPLDHVEIKLEIPEYFIFRKYGKGSHPIEVNESKENRSINVSYTTKDLGARYIGRGTTKHTGKVEFMENIHHVITDNIPALLDERYTSNMDNYRTSIKFELAATRFPNNPYKNYSLTWEGVAKSIYDYDDFGNELAKTNYFREDLENLLEGLGGDEEKAIAIFEFVKAKMNWNNYVGVTCESGGVRKAYKEETGNAAEINLMLTSMFRYAGLKANPVLISTRSHGIPLFPTSDGFNYVVAALEMQDHVLLFDATEKNSLPNIMPLRALNWTGRLIREDGSSAQVGLMPKKKSLDVTMMTVDMQEDGLVAGKIREQFTVYNAFSFRNRYFSVSEDSFLESLEKKQGDIEISEYEIQNKNNLSKPIVQSYDFVKEGAFESISGKLYVSPLFHLATLENPFKADKREFPIDYGFPWEDRYIVNIKIPDGYAVESYPEPIAVALPDNLGKFMYNITVNQNMVSVDVKVDINSGVLPARYYQDLKELYRHIVEKEAEKIVLTKT